jgi:hypothetical protein
MRYFLFFFNGSNMAAYQTGSEWAKQEIVRNNQITTKQTMLQKLKILLVDAFTAMWMPMFSRSLSCSVVTPFDKSPQRLARTTGSNCSLNISVRIADIICCCFPFLGTVPKLALVDHPTSATITFPAQGRILKFSLTDDGNIAYYHSTDLRLLSERNDVSMSHPR